MSRMNTCFRKYLNAVLATTPKKETHTHLLKCAPQTPRANRGSPTTKLLQVLRKQNPGDRHILRLDN
jgi:hypothetical protein